MQQNQNNTSGQSTNTLLLVIIAVLATIVVGLVLAIILWPKSSEVPQAPAPVAKETIDVESEATLIATPADGVSPEDVATLTALVGEWDTMLNSRDEAMAYSLYAPSVMYYTQRCSVEEILSVVRKFYAKNPDFSQTSYDLHFSKVKEGILRCDFKKSTVSGGKTKDYPSYLEFTKMDGRWRISCESDAVTDHNINKRR